jgi:phage replication-related protein YjqB (UPF0714/DUF867 family)
VFDRLLRCPDVREHMVLGSRVGFLALHGGIEPGTEGMAVAAAATSGASAYVVIQPRSLAWHVPSHRVAPERVPRLAEFLAHVDLVISVHGYWRPEQPDAIFVGGANRQLAEGLATSLRAAIDEMPVVDDLAAIPRGMRGVDPRNPVNRTRRGGVQLELPHRARTDGPPSTWERPLRPGSVAARLTTVLSEFAADQAA